VGFDDGDHFIAVIDEEFLREIGIDRLEQLDSLESLSSCLVAEPTKSQ